jgi:Leu/Phe-tRNA-protein transferase
MNETTAPSDWLFTKTWDLHFVERLLAHGLFTIPDEPGTSPMLMLPNPLNRYCLDLSVLPPHRRRFNKSKEMRVSKRQQYRLSVNSDFRKSLHALMAYHNENNNNGTWMTTELVDLFHAMNENKNSLVKHWVFELWSQEETKKQQHGNKKTPDRDRQYHVGEETWTLVSVTAGMSVGTCFHDYSMATLVRDKRCLGHVLTKTVAALLTKSGYQMWYWGYKNGYMASYDLYGGKSYNRETFWKQWGEARDNTPMLNIRDVIAEGKALVQPLWHMPDPDAVVGNSDNVAARQPAVLLPTKDSKTVAISAGETKTFATDNGSNSSPRRDVLQTLPTFMKKQILAFFGYKDYMLTARTCQYLKKLWTEAVQKKRLPLFVPVDCNTLKAAVKRVHEEDHLITIVLGKGEHIVAVYKDEMGDDMNGLEIPSAMNIMGDPKEKVVVTGGFWFKKGIQGNCHLQHLTVRQAKYHGVFGQSSFTMDDVIVEQCDWRGVYATGTGVVGRCTNVEVQHCGDSGVMAGDSAFITLIGAKTTVHHNCTKGHSDSYGLNVNGSSSGIQFVSPLTKETVSSDNGGGGNHTKWVVEATIGSTTTISPRGVHGGVDF